MSWTLTTSPKAKYKAGVNANATLLLDNTILTAWSDQVEGLIVGITKKDVIADYALVNTYVKALLDDLASGEIAMRIIQRQMNGFTDQAEADTMLNILKDNNDKCWEAIKKTDFNKIADVT